MSKYKIGDRVRIVKRRTEGNWNLEGKMDKWLGTVMTVRRELWQDTYEMKEDGGQWRWSADMIEGLVASHQTITINHDSKTTTATLYENGNAVRTAKAMCNTDDTFDFQVGAKLAFERLIEPFVPHLKCGEYNYGNIGELTKIKDLRGEALYIGDTVELYNSAHQFVAECAVANYCGKNFIVGIECACSSSGSVDDKWIILKKRSYADVKHGEKVDYITYIKEEFK